MKPGTRKRRKNFRGIIGPSGWDTEGNVIAVSIFTFEEEEFPIESSLAGFDLAGYMHKEVEVEGTIKNAGGSKKFKVDSFRILA